MKDNKEIILANWQLYDLEKDPSEVRNLFKMNEDELREMLSGDLLSTFENNHQNLKIACTEYFIPYFEEEISKGYKKPSYPLKLWINIIRNLTTKTPTEYRSRFLKNIGYGEKFFDFNYCHSVRRIQNKISGLCTNGFVRREITKYWWVVNKKHISVNPK